MISTSLILPISSLKAGFRVQCILQVIQAACTLKQLLAQMETNYFPQRTVDKNICNSVA